MKDFHHRRNEIFEELPRKHLIVFGNLTCEKMLKQYELFSKVHHWGRAQFFQDTIINIYDYVTGGIPEMDFEALVEELENNSPDLDEFEGSLAAYALDSCVALAELLEFIESDDLEHIKETSQNSINTLDMYVQEVEDLNPNDRNLKSLISENPLMRTEVERHFRLLRELQQIDVINATAITKLQEINLTFPYLDNLSSLHKL